jgi:ATPase family protein associated with various cellular activities (AAA)
MSRRNGTSDVLETIRTDAIPAEMTEHDRQAAQILAALDQLGKTRVGEDGLIFRGTQFILPETMRGQVGSAIRYLKDYEEQQENEFQFSRQFNYRPWDGAAAFQRAMRRVFGSSGVGVPIKTFFGKVLPEFRSINISATETLSVPWRNVGFSPMEATFQLAASRHEEYGVVFTLGVEAPRKHRARIEAFFDIVAEELKTGSIYKGKAFTGGAEPLFLDLDNLPPVVYSDDVLTHLDTNMWSLLRYSDTMRANRINLKRAVLVEGPYGTGKTLAGMLTAREAVAHGWTFILARPGKDDLFEVLQTAQLYAPAVVWYEDIDTIAQGTDDMQISRLLDVLDGITNKGTEVLAGFTTNHVGKIQKGVLRPGRLDAVIHVGGLDRAGYERLIKAVVPGDQLARDVDYDAVADAFADFLPAFAKEAISRAMAYSISRNRGQLGVITTDDLKNAADGLRPQLKLMNDATEGVRPATVESTFASLLDRRVREAINATKFVDGDGDTTTGDYATGLQIDTPGSAG